MGPSDEAIPVVPADASEALPSGPLRSGEDLLAPPFFLIAADLHDGRWLTIEPSFRAQRRRLMRSLAFIFIGTLLIAAIAVLTARSLIAPLSQLATAADALGRSPEIIETPRPGIREFAAIHKAFETMQTRLKRFVGERTHMLAAISHDLRTPLTRLRIQAEFIGDGELREGMLANIDAMRDMLTETLSFAEGDARTEASSSFDLASILISLCDEASDAGAEAEYDGPDHVTAFGRRTAIRRMFSNLIDNAWRYGGAARVSLRENATDWIVVVADDGPGSHPNRSSRPSNRFRDWNPRAIGRPAARGSACRSPATLRLRMAGRFRSPTLHSARGDLSSAFCCQRLSPPRARALSILASSPLVLRCRCAALQDEGVGKAARSKCSAH